MEKTEIPFYRTLAGRMLLFGILPTGIILSGGAGGQGTFPGSIARTEKISSLGLLML
jgi:hypothetical protein